MSAAWMGKGKGDLEDASALFPFAHAPSRNCSLDLVLLRTDSEVLRSIFSNRRPKERTCGRGNSGGLAREMERSMLHGNRASSGWTWSRPGREEKEKAGWTRCVFHRL